MFDMYKFYCSLLFLNLMFCFGSCVKIKDIYEEQEFRNYLYPYSSENSEIDLELLVQLKENSAKDDIKAQIPILKYNKSWLMLLTQDDCVHSAFSNTWAAINGKPLYANYYYDIAHLIAGDLPPGAYYLGKTLGSTDGTGKEIRFAFTTTLAPEYEWMNEASIVRVGYKTNYYRFAKKNGLIWDNVRVMLNYGVGIAFHDVETEEVHNIDSIVSHYNIAQNIITSKLNGRGCKILAEPNGNYDYVKAALVYNPIQLMTAQNNTKDTLYPFKVVSDLNKKLIHRYDNKDPNMYRSIIVDNLISDREKRKAIHVLAHATDYKWVSFLEWINDQYGKDGDDSVWFPSMEEYYEYNYYRIHSKIETAINGNILKIKIRMPAGQYFYYPSITLNLKGIRAENIQSIQTDDVITGFSYGNYEEGTMLNIDCYKYLYERALFFSEQYLANPTDDNSKDAFYFINQLKESDKKNELLRRIGY
ncbi:MAG: hypothetical protein AB7E53_03220 [Macellibacteroides sp.]|uniref:hypothetical protein n=1 Tax=Macellibacteroides sp. TaxID=2014584 RepID=UPI003E7BB7F9